MHERATSIEAALRQAGLPRIDSINEGRGGDSIAVMLTLNGITHTIEGRGDTDTARITDVVQQFGELTGISRP